MKENKNEQNKDNCLYTNKSVPIKQYKNLYNKSVKDLIFKENRNMSGIYKWTNLINDNFYIGSSINLSKRFLKYFNTNMLTKNNMLINRAILKYGHIKFTLEILEYCSPKDIIEREQYYLDLLKPKYNTLKIAGSTYGYKHNKASLIKLKTRVVTEKTLDKMKARIQTEETKTKISKALGIPVLVTDLDKEDITKYISKVQAAVALGVSEFTIRRYITTKKLLLNRYLIVEIKPEKKRKVSLLVRWVEL